METAQGQKITFGDIVLIAHDDRYLTVADDYIQLSFQPSDPTGKSQKLLVCGKEGEGFYLTFKYAPGFIHLEGSHLVNGAPWIDRSYFDLDGLKSALGVDHLTFHLTEE
jgi:hypothetical protein